MNFQDIVIVLLGSHPIELRKDHLDDKQKEKET